MLQKRKCGKSNLLKKVFIFPRNSCKAMNDIFESYIFSQLRAGPGFKGYNNSTCQQHMQHLQHIYSTSRSICSKIPYSNIPHSNSICQQRMQHLQHTVFSTSCSICSRLPYSNITHSNSTPKKPHPQHRHNPYLRQKVCLRHRLP